MSALREANLEFKRGNYSKAIELYERVLDKDPSLSKAFEFNIELAEHRLKNSVLICSDRAEVSTFRADGRPKSSRVRESSLKASDYSEKHFAELVPTDYEGRVEKVSGGNVRGWAVCKNSPSSVFELNVLLDGVLYCQVKNDGSRQDLLRHGKSKGKGGYSFTIPETLLVHGKHDLTIRFPDGAVLGELEVEGKAAFGARLATTAPVNKSVSVIVPIYNALDDVKVCIQRLWMYTSKNANVILINDGSPDPEVECYLNGLDLPVNYKVYHNQENLGFTRTVNRGIDLAESDDVVLLNSDARVTPRWLEGLRRALATDAKIATVTPMSDRAGAFSAPNIGNDNNLPEGIREEDYAVAFRRRSAGYYSTVPTGNGFCMYIRRSALNDLGSLDAEAFPRGYGEENDFCMRARDSGWRNVIDDRTYVFHDRNKSFGGQKSDLIKAGRSVVDERYPDYKKATSVFSESPAISAARFRGKQALDDVIKGTKIKPRILFVVSTLTGGTPQTNRDLMLALYDNVEPWLLHCDSETITLFKVNKDTGDDVVGRHILIDPVDVLSHVSHEYDAIVKQWLAEYDFEVVHIRHLAWHSLSLARLASEEGARVIKSFHDFYAACPTVKLLDEGLNFCEGSCTKTSGDCTIDLWRNKSALPKLKGNWVHYWRDKFNKLVFPYCGAFVTTHSSIKNTLLKVVEVPEEDFHVIPHGRDFETFHQLAARYKPGDVLKILVPGNIGVAKGRDIIREIVRLDEGRNIHFHILGKVSLPTGSGITVHGEYNRDEFAAHVKSINPHVGAILSIWNETWCHTLTELWSVGLPVLATRYETVEGRIRESDSGWVLKGEDPESIYQEILSLMGKPHDLNLRLMSTVDAQNNIIKNNGNLNMANKYLDVYRLARF